MFPLLLLLLLLLLLFENLKKDLELLKDSHASLDEIRYVSRLLRSKLAKKTSTITSCETLDHDLSISKNFWGYVKLFLQKKPSLLPSFSLERCKQFFIETLSAKHPNKQFPIPSWIPSFSNPTHPFHSDPPPYQKITSIIRRMKSSSSTCPIDKISVICFKRCQIQKGFTHQISGTLEHTAMMSHIIDKARIKQRSLVITLLDLKNAFGEVYHNLIKSVLSFYHVPEKNPVPDFKSLHKF